MLKKIDRLLLQSFLGPFILTLAVVIFILLINQMVQRLDEITGKGLGFDVFLELLFYFALHLVPMALPLSILLASLISFGNLGEHFELTAMKSSGISLVRVLRPILVFSILLTGFSFWFSDQIVPEANLRVFSLLWDIKQKSPSLSIKEGTFYNGLPNYSIKIHKKFPDGKTLKGVMIYNHTAHLGNRELIIADSGKMYTIDNEKYLVLELFKGKSYHDQVGGAGGVTQNLGYSNEKFIRNTFQKSQLVFSLSSFDMKDTDKNLFKGHKLMHSAIQLVYDMDSVQRVYNRNEGLMYELVKSNYFYMYRQQVQDQQNNELYASFDTMSPQKIINYMAKKNDELDKKDNPKKDEKQKDSTNKNLTNNTTNKTPEKTAVQTQLTQPTTQFTNQYKPMETVENSNKKLFRKGLKNIDTLKTQSKTVWHITPSDKQIVARAIQNAHTIEVAIKEKTITLKQLSKERNEIQTELHKKFTYALACFAMFLIGAPLGAIIKKGGLGIPILMSIVFFIAFYVMSLMGEKWVKEGLTNVWIGMWFPNVILITIGLFFLRQARNDSRLFEADIYYIWLDKIKMAWEKYSRKKGKNEVKTETNVI